MKAIILAGGYGTRLSEETHLRPKPMVEIGDRPILWHIMKIYSAHGIHDFIICCGYKGYVIKEYFANYFLHTSDVTFDMQTNQMEVHQRYAEPWRITLVDTGEGTQTGGRLKRVKDYVSDETFCFTYGDGVSDVNITELITYHQQQGVSATLTAVQPAGRFGSLNMDDQGHIISFQEKPKGDGNWINAGFFVLEPRIFELIEGDQTVWEQAPLQHLANKQQLAAFHHHGFWQAMDTLRDKVLLENLWTSNQAPWKVW
jgi:glucose-1-phosphate cytidylyltransferase